MKKTHLLAVAAVVALALGGCGDGRDTIQPGSPQWNAAHDTSQADARAGKKVIVHVPASMYKPGAGGTPPPNVTIVPDPDK